MYMNVYDTMLLTETVVIYAERFIKFCVQHSVTTLYGDICGTYISRKASLGFLQVY